MFNAESLPKLRQSDLEMKTFVPSTILSRRPSPWANQRPINRSLSPSLYTSAVSQKFIPEASALSMISTLSAASVTQPKFIVPKHSGLTFKPLRPRDLYSINHFSFYCIVERLVLVEVEEIEQHMPSFKTRNGMGNMRFFQSLNVFFS
jgi:hypothetical protein